MSEQDLFHFRDFSMKQATSGQRVNTDSCVFAALLSENSIPRRILDIGTGTGVVALMLSRRFPYAAITAVEPEAKIASVAEENFQNSHGQQPIRLLMCRAQEIPAALNGSFDLVVCNPPYFQNSRLSKDRLRATARHNTDLAPEELYIAMRFLLSRDGAAWISFPTDSAAYWLHLAAKNQFHCTKIVTVADHPEAFPHMTIAGFALNENAVCDKQHVFYRKTRNGPLSEWMQAFREEWYPEKFNRQFFG